MSRVNMSGTKAEFPTNVGLNGDDNLARAVPASAQPQAERLSQRPHSDDTLPFRLYFHEIA